MKKLIFPAAICAVMFLSAFTFYSATNWKIADGYSIKFTSPDPSGAFTKLMGDIKFDPNSLQDSRFEVSIDAASINTGNGTKNANAKSDKWFDTAKYPVIKFTSKTITKTTTGYQAAGTLDMHGIQKPLNIPFTFQNNTFTGSFDINRLDYHVGTDQGMQAHASAKLKVDVSVPVTR